MTVRALSSIPMHASLNSMYINCMLQCKLLLMARYTVKTKGLVPLARVTSVVVAAVKIGMCASMHCMCIQSLCCQLAQIVATAFLVFLNVLCVQQRPIAVNNLKAEVEGNCLLQVAFHITVLDVTSP